VSIFLDTGVFVAFENPRDTNHRAAMGLVEAAAEGAWGEVFTSDYVFDEAVTTALQRTRRPDAALRVGRLILGTGPLGRLTGLVYVSPELFLRSWQQFVRLIERGLSFTDCTTLELMRSLRVGEIASFDADFDGFVVRRSNRPD
jgi:uncharacterized protein